MAAFIRQGVGEECAACFCGQARLAAGVLARLAGGEEAPAAGWQARHAAGVEARSAGGEEAPAAGWQAGHAAGVEARSAGGWAVHTSADEPGGVAVRMLLLDGGRRRRLGWRNRLCCRRRLRVTLRDGHSSWGIAPQL